MDQVARRAIAVVGVGAVLPDAPSAQAFWANVVGKRYSISETPADRWSVADYYDPDPSAPDKSYTKIGGWVRDFRFDWQRFRIPPKVAQAMDQGQQWAATCAAEALADYGYPDRPLNTENTGVILGTAMGGELHYHTHQRVVFPEFANMLRATPMFHSLAPAVQAELVAQFHAQMDRTLPSITEDSMPGELPNIVAGRVANLLNLRGPNFITDAACASTFAAVDAAVELLSDGRVDAVLTGGIDRNMGPSTFVKFCKIGALSATGTRPFGDGADGFVMGEGGAVFLLKRLEDAERDGDRIYAVIRGVGASSDGKGKGITAPNPVGQIFAIERAWRNAGLDPATCNLVEAHGTSTRVGDVAELESLTKVFAHAEQGSIGLGSAKSNIGHLKAGAGAAGLLKAVMALHAKVLPPTLNAERPNPKADFAHSPFRLQHNPEAWERRGNLPRRAAVSAYGFGGTNFHLVLEEYVPGMIRTEPQRYSGVSLPQGDGAGSGDGRAATPAPVRGILALGAATEAALLAELQSVVARVATGWTPPLALPDKAILAQPERLVIDFADAVDLGEKLAKASKAAAMHSPAAWRALQGQGVFRGSGKPAGKVAFLFPGQGSQYLNMGRELATISPVVAQVFAEADAVMTPILGRSLTSYLFVEGDDPAVLKKAERELMQTAITQPAMLTLDIAMMKLLESYGIRPDMVMGHSLGEYAALVSAGIMPFAESLEAAAARGAEMTRVSVDDNGWMAAVMAPLDVITQTLAECEGYVVAANINSYGQAVIGGESKAVEQAIGRFVAKGYQALRIPVSHAFHTRIVAPAAAPLRKLLNRLHIAPPRLPLVANVTGGIYPTDVEAIKDILEQQIASPVQWVRGLETLYAEGCRVFVECGPKRALKGFVDDVLGSKPDLVSLFTNHPKNGELASFNQALCGLYAAGLVQSEAPVAHVAPPAELPRAILEETTVTSPNGSGPQPSAPLAPAGLEALGSLLAQALQAAQPQAQARGPQVYDRDEVPSGSVVISGTGLGLPGPAKSLMDPENALRILRGEQFIDLIPERFRAMMLRKNIIRLVKGEDGGGQFVAIDNPDDVVRLAGRAGSFDLHAEYGVPDALIEALDRTTQLAMAAGLDALREAGLPLVQTYRLTSRGTHLPDRWMLPEPLRDETGVIFASAFPGMDRMADDLMRYFTYESRQTQVEQLEKLRSAVSDPSALGEINRMIAALREDLAREPYTFDRRFIFRVLAMGHSQFAEYIGARGPNTSVNAACASTTQAIALAEDWIRNGRCRRVLVIASDDVTSDRLMEWVGAGFLATGAAATDDAVAEAALPFDKRRHGTILGMGACALVVESEDAVRERGMRGIVEVLASETANSAFHGTRLNVDHISQVMDRLIVSAERRFGINRLAIAPQTVFVSHETFTPARGGSAAAEVAALRHNFGPAADSIIIANTKGFTGHAMGVGVEDVIAVKILEHGVVPPVPNFREIDPELGLLNLSRGGRYPVQYAIHLAAGFGSQLALTLLRRVPGGLDRVDSPAHYRFWLDQITGYDRAETEVVQRVLRVKSTSAPARTPAPSPWRYGTGPMVRAATPGSPQQVADLPQPTQRSYAAPVAPPPVAVASAPAPVAPPPVAVAPAPAPVAPPPVAVAPAPAPVAPPPVAVAPAPAPVAPPPAPTVNPVEAQVLTLVAEKTGYPSDMLDLDLDLEADLGVDTVKQAETFEAVRGAFNIPRPENLALRDYPTLRRVIEFVYESRPELKQVSAPAPVAPPPAPVAPAAPTVNPVEAQVLALVADKTGYPSDMLDLDLDLEADLGVDTVKQAETFEAVRGAFNIPRPENLALRDYPTLRRVIEFVYESRPELKQVSAPAPVAPPPAPVAPAAPTVNPVEAQVLALVADKTGYPSDMLDLDLDLEADLGVDTVKQAETFEAVRGAFNIPRPENLALRDYPTLRRVIEFVYESRPDLKAAPAPVAAPTPVSAPAPTPVAAPAPVSSPAPVYDAVAEQVLALVADKTGYPTEMLDLDLDLEADLGVDTVKQAETFEAVRGAFNIPRPENLALRDYPTLRRVIEFVYQFRPDLKPSSAPAPVSAAPVSAAPVSVAPISLPTPVSAAPVSTPAPTSDPVAEQVLALVADKTGYPTEMLDLDLDLEADLGVDTVKQAETFEAVRGAFNIPRPENLALRDYPTLRRVIEFVYEYRPDLKPSSAPAPVMAPAPTSDAAPASDPVAAQVLALVADKTGYPTEMLDLDLDLEADLGVDTVKQAETFEAVRGAFNIPRPENLALRDYPTLRRVIEFVYEYRPELRAGGAAPAAASAPAPSAAPLVSSAPTPSVSYDVAEADRAPRRVPTPVLRPALEMCQPTGALLDSGSRVIVMMDRSGVGKALVGRLQKRGVVALTFEEPPSTTELEERLSAWMAEGPIQGIYWLPALDVEPDLDEMDLATFREATRGRVKNLFLTLRTLYAHFSGPQHFLVSATRLGGLHGYEEAGASAPLGGGVTGLTKSFKRERIELTVKAVDFELNRKTADPAEALIAETLYDPGVIEVGYHEGLRFSINFQELPAADGNPGMVLGQESVFVVTGAAGGITNAIVADLAGASGGIFYLLDLTPTPEANDPQIAQFRSDREALKLSLIEELKAAGERPTPVQIERRLAQIERSDAALRAIEAVQAAGGTAHYRSLNLLDGPAVAAVVAEVAERHGRIDVLLHAGGIEISKSMPSKEPREFDMVFDIKADGFFSLLNAAKAIPIGATVAFSSVAGRFGNSGQPDYSAANDLLCKITSSLRRTRPQTRGIVIDWTAWGGIGMATRGSIPKIMEAAGITMLPPEVGIPTIRRELTAGGTRGEILVGMDLGILTAELAPQGGLDPERVKALLATREPPLAMIGTLTSACLYGGIEAETLENPQQQPFLDDHRIEGTAVLPGVMGTEAFAEIASLLAPGYQIAEIDHDRFASPFKFYRDQPRTLYLRASVRPQPNGDLIAHTELRSVLKPPKEGLPEQITLHFSADVLLSRTPVEPPEPAPLWPVSDEVRVYTTADIYGVYFHGPAYQVLDRVLIDEGRAIGVMSNDRPPAIEPPDAATLIDPLLIEFCFQTAGIWQASHDGVLALPAEIDSVSVFRATPPPGDPQLYAIVTPVSEGLFDAQVRDEAGNVYVAMRGYHTIALPGTVEL
ncbi:type I polyketide synthase [Candidatus Oscillochloris fontis]|uniref:type I polyketide synthase n=1 Tax=Candidatus Oscillochloris fontis TaxID=2496868 RepID=UPI00101C042F|nr:type I polyketide synthase [Candidatus Oscillochloris fontis]